MNLSSCMFFFATGLNTWPNFFFTAYQDDEGSISSIRLYMIPSAFAHSNCISRCWVSVVVFSTWVIQSRKDLSPLPSYVCRSAKKWPFLCWVCNSENLEIGVFVSLCKACCWLHSSITDGSVLPVHKCPALVVVLAIDSCRGSDSLVWCFVPLAAHFHLLYSVNSGLLKIWSSKLCLLKSCLSF